MKPGVRTRPFASMRRAACDFRSSGRRPTAAIRSPATATSARNAGAPVPSTTLAPSKTRSSREARGAADTKKKAATASVAARIRELIFPSGRRRAGGNAPGTRGSVARSARAAAAAAATFGLRACLVHANRAAVMLRAVQRLDRLLRVRVAHLDESESLRAPGIAIDDHRRGLHGAVALEESPEAGVVHPVREVSHIELHSRWSFPSGSTVSPKKA